MNNYVLLCRLVQEPEEALMDSSGTKLESHFRFQYVFWWEDSVLSMLHGLVTSSISQSCLTQRSPNRVSCISEVF